MKRFLALPLALLVLLTGCSSYSDINDSNIFTSLTVDRKENKYLLGGGVIGIKSLQANGGIGTKVTFVQAQGKTLAQASASLERELANQNFYGAVRSVVLTEDFAKENISSYMELMKQQLNARLTVDLFTTPQPPSELIDSEPINSFSTGFALEELTKSVAAQGLGIQVKVGDVLESIADDSGSYLIPSVRLKEGQVMLRGYSVFKQNKQVTNLSFEKSQGVCWLLAKDPQVVYEIDCDGLRYTIKCSRVGKKVTTSFENGQLYAAIALQVRAQVIQKVDLKDGGISEKTDAAMRDLRAQVEDRVDADVERTLAHAKKYGCDYLGLYRDFRTKENDFPTGDVYNTLFEQLRFDVQVGVEWEDAA